MKNRCLALALTLVFFLLAACGSAASPKSQAGAESNYGNLLATQTPEPSEPYVIKRTAANTWTDMVGSTWVQIVVEIENTGSVPLYLRGSRADLETGDGKLFAVIDRLSGDPQIILPGERGVYTVETTLDAAPDGELVVVPYLDVKEATVPATRVAVSDVTVSADQYGWLKAMGRVENTNGMALERVSISVLLFDAEGNCIGCLTTTLTDGVPAGEKRGFEAKNIMLPDYLTPEDVASIEAYAYPYQYQR